MVKVPINHGRFCTPFPPPPIVIIQVTPVLQITQNPFLLTKLFLECLNPEEESNTVIRNVRRYSRSSYSFTSNKTEILSNITLRNEQHKLDSVVKRKNLYLSKVNVSVGKTVATLDTRECSLAAPRWANNNPLFVCDIEETYVTGNKGEFLRSLNIYVKGTDLSRRR